MNLQKYTQNSLAAVQAAQDLAVERQNQQIEQEHLLLTLLEQKDGLIGELVTKAGADSKRLRQKAQEAVNALPQISGSGAGQV